MLQVLARVRAGGEPLAPTLRTALRELPEREARAFATDVAYGALRWEIALEAALGARLDDPGGLPARVRDVLLAGAFEKLVRGTPPHAAVHAWVETVNRGPKRERGLAGLVNAVLRRVDLADVHGDAARSLPGWLAERMRALLGDDDLAVRAAEDMLRPEPFWLTAFDAVAGRASLEAEGARIAPGPLPESLAVRLPVPLERTDAFRRGLVQPQNPASLAVARACRPRPGERALDLCGGRAIKAAYLAARGARVTTVEVDPAVAAEGARNLERLGVGVHALVADLRTPPPGLDPAPLVLLDAPCSGTGTLRGHPEIKRRLSQDAVAAAARLQDELLSTAAALAEPGGRIVYAVCALTPDEGPERIAALLARRPELRVVRPAVDVAAVDVSHGVVIPPLDGLDGFFVSELRVPGR